MACADGLPSLLQTVVAVRQGAQGSTILAAINQPPGVVIKTVERALQDDGWRERMMMPEPWGSCRLCLAFYLWCATSRVGGALGHAGLAGRSRARLAPASHSGQRDYHVCGCADVRGRVFPESLYNTSL